MCERYLGGGEVGIKKTCLNCKNFIAVLCNESGSFYHIHNWCTRWQRQVNDSALSGRFEYEGGFYDDLETGDAFCYMFEPLDVPAKPDEWFEKNKRHNLEHVITD